MTRWKPQGRGRANALKDGCACVCERVLLCEEVVAYQQACMWVWEADGKVSPLPCPLDTAKFTLRGRVVRCELVSNICCRQCYRRKTFEIQTFWCFKTLAEGVNECQLTCDDWAVVLAKCVRAVSKILVLWESKFSSVTPCFTSSSVCFSLQSSSICWRGCRYDILLNSFLWIQFLSPVLSSSVSVLSVSLS